jgi:hypothetical protein
VESKKLNAFMRQRQMSKIPDRRVVIPEEVGTELFDFLEVPTEQRLTQVQPAADQTPALHFEIEYGAAVFRVILTLDQMGIPHYDVRTATKNGPAPRTLFSGKYERLFDFMTRKLPV